MKTKFNITQSVKEVFKNMKITRILIFSLLLAAMTFALLPAAAHAEEGVTEQYNDLAAYLVGKDVSALQDLYFPANITKDADTFTAATLRSSKLISAINDGLNRGLYALPKE